MSDIPEAVDEEGPRTVQRGHMTRTTATLRDGRVKVAHQQRMHRFESGMHNVGRPRPEWSGSLDEAKALHRILDLLLYDGDEPNLAEADKP